MQGHRGLGLWAKQRAQRADTLTAAVDIASAHAHLRLVYLCGHQCMPLRCLAKRALRCTVLLDDAVAGLRRCGCAICA